MEGFEGDPLRWSIFAAVAFFKVYEYQGSDFCWLHMHVVFLPPNSRAPMNQI